VPRSLAQLTFATELEQWPTISDALSGSFTRAAGLQ